MSFVTKLFGVFTTCSLILANGAFAADSPSPSSIDGHAVDDDFPCQGEYSGTLTNPGNYLEPVGLQVVARGNGHFLATEYRGGLPGQGWDGVTKSNFEGDRKDSLLTLSGETYRITVQNGRAWIWDAARHQVGQLQKVERKSPTLGAAPPPGAIVLFNGSNTDQFENGRMTEDGLLTPVRPGTVTKSPYQNFFLHIEFRTPYRPTQREQGRGNSGVYIQGRYEVQILDSFGLEPKYNEAGSLYKQRKPDWNMSYPPLTWQTYDITFQAPRFDAEGKKFQNARITVLLNGVPVHNDVEVIAKTGAGAPEGPEARPIKLQEHGNAVEFRNIWLIDYGSPTYGTPNATQYASADCSGQGYCQCRTRVPRCCRPCRRCR